MSTASSMVFTYGGVRDSSTPSMPIGLSIVVGSGGERCQRPHFFGFCMRNSMPNFPLAGSRSNRYGAPTAA
jgi:hypothetical protein